MERNSAIYHQAYGLNGSIPVTYEVIWAFAKKAEFLSIC
jgi:hypothetical protein